MKSYACTICRKKHVKLWRPYMNSEPLICATCAEERQSPREYEEHEFEKKSDHYVGTPTGKKLSLEKWEVDEKGKIPSCWGPGPEGLTMEMTDQLIVNLKDVTKSYSSGQTTMIPAIPNGNGAFWAYTAVPEKSIKWWEQLPTK